jgi:transposase
MAKGYSNDLRVRAVELVESGESAREAARILNLGVSTTIRWMDRWRKTGSVDAKPGTGHSRSPLDQHKQWLIELLVLETLNLICESKGIPHDVPIHIH